VRQQRQAKQEQPDPSIAVVIPCHNEETVIDGVVRDLREALPAAQVYVCDNASTDATAKVAEAAGAIPFAEPHKGKGNAVRRMFADVDADVYVMVDGDGTYDPAVAPTMVRMLLDRNLDMVVATRQSLDGHEDPYRRGHVLGNVLLTQVISRLFHENFSDVLSGYRVMSRRFVKSLPVFSAGFEIEAELSAHAVRVRAACDEVAAMYRARPVGSPSKLRTYRDGLRILLHSIRLYEEMRPFPFFALWFALLSAVALGLGIPVVDEFARTGQVLRFPTSFLALGIQVVAFICLTAGVILRSVGRTRDEARRLAYLSMPPPSSLRGSMASRALSQRPGAVGLPLQAQPAEVPRTSPDRRLPG
jgi:glycosyltransferase involved in cell wall biosynthesis